MVYPTNQNSEASTKSPPCSETRHPPDEANSHCGTVGIPEANPGGKSRGLGEAAGASSDRVTLILAGHCHPLPSPIFILGDLREHGWSLQPSRGGPGAARGSRSRAGQAGAVREQEIPAAPHGRDYGRDQGAWMPRAERLCSQTAPRLRASAV